MHAIVVRDAQGLHLVARIARRPSGIFYLMQRDAKAFQIDSDKPWDPHASYHVDGWHQFKSFGKHELPKVKRQPLDSDFSGAQALFAQSFFPGDLYNLRVIVEACSFVDVFAIPREILCPGDNYTIAVDLLAPGAGRLEFSGAEAVLEHSFLDASPCIHATLWRWGDAPQRDGEGTTNGAARD